MGMVCFRLSPVVCCTQVLKAFQNFSWIVFLQKTIYYTTKLLKTIYYITIIKNFLL